MSSNANVGTVGALDLSATFVVDANVSDSVNDNGGAHVQGAVDDRVDGDIYSKKRLRTSAVGTMHISVLPNIL
jgi:hypothetical protein